MSERLVVDVKLAWCGDAIAVRRFAPGQIAKLGDGPGCLAPVPCAAEGDWPIARVDGRAARVVVPPKGAGDRAHVVFGDFEVDVTPALEEVVPAKGKRAFAFAPMLHLLIAAAAHGVVMIAGASAASADEETVDARNRYDLQQMLARADERAQASDDPKTDGDGPGHGAVVDGVNGDGRRGGGARARGLDGVMGDRTATRQRGRFGVDGGASGASAPRKRLDARKVARATQLGERSTSPASPSGADVDALGPDSIAAAGAMRAAFVGSSPGLGALGLHGTGEGGGGRVDAIGLGDDGPLGHTPGDVGAGSGGDGTPSGLSVGGGWGGSWGSSWDVGIGTIGHRVRAPTVSGASASVRADDQLPPGVIQRIVRANFGRFRACYEEGLRRNPTLTGRVVASFIVGANGRVSRTGDGGSTLADAAVSRCVVAAFGGLEFPREAGGGDVSVTYPIVLEPR
jgi:hypothetical protein